MVLGHSKAKHRAKIFDKMVGIAAHLHNLNNYASLQAVCAGLEEMSVRRLTHTKSLLAPQTEQHFIAACRQMDPTGSYERYRGSLRRNAAAAQSAIPFLLVLEPC